MNASFAVASNDGGGGDESAPPCYLPQLNDDVPSQDMTKPMGPIGKHIYWVN